MPRHLLRVTDLDAAGLRAALDLAARMKARPHGFVDVLRGDTVACLFERERRMRDLASFQVTEEMMGAARPDAVFMHCLPAHRGEEVAAEVIDGPQSIVWQAESRLPTEEAILYALIARTWDAPGASPP